MGYVVRGQCFASADAAHAAYYGGASASSVVSGAFHEVTVIESAALGRVSSSGWSKEYAVTDGLGARSVAYVVDLPVVAFPECDYAEPWLDGMAVGWGVAFALIAISALLLMRRGIR